MPPKSPKKKASNFANWKVSQKYIRIDHNKQVVNWLRGNATTARINLRNSLLIYAKDTASQCLVKMQYFKDYIEPLTRKPLALPLAVQTRVLPNRAQLAIIYKPSDPKSKTGYYTLHIPHYDGSRNPIFTAYTKGNFWGKYKLKDGSPLQAYASSKTEVERVIREMMRYVSKKMLLSSKKIATGFMPHEPFNTLKVKPIRADFYPDGHRENSQPKWRKYYVNFGK